MSLAPDARSRNKLDQQAVFIKRSIFNAIEKLPNEDTITKETFTAYLAKEGYLTNQDDIDEMWSYFKPGSDGKVDHIQFFVASNFDPFIQKLQTLTKVQLPRTPSKAQSRQVLAKMHKVGELQTTFETIAEEDRRRRLSSRNLLAGSSPRINPPSPRSHQVVVESSGEIAAPVTVTPTVVVSSDEASLAAEGPGLVVPEESSNTETGDSSALLKSQVGQLSEQVIELASTMGTELLDMDDRVSLLEKAATPIKRYNSGAAGVEDAEDPVEAVQTQLNSLTATVDTKIEESTQLTAQIMRNVLTKMSELEAKVDTAATAAPGESPATGADPALETRVTQTVDTKLKQLETRVDAALGKMATELTKSAESQIVSVAEGLEASIDKTKTQTTVLIKQLEERISSPVKQPRSNLPAVGDEPDGAIEHLCQRIEALEKDKARRATQESVTNKYTGSVVKEIAIKSVVACAIGSLFAAVLFRSNSSESSQSSSGSVSRSAVSGIAAGLVVLSSNLLDVFVFNK